MIYLPKVMSLLRNGGQIRRYSKLGRGRMFVTEAIGEGFVLTHELHPTAAAWLTQHEEDTQ